MANATPVYDPIPSETKRALSRTGLLDQRSVRHLWKAARDWKPSTYGIHYDDHQRKVRLLFEGKRRAVLSDVLADIYPTTWRTMPQAGVNLVKQSAEVDTTVHDRPTRRWIVRDGHRLFAEDVTDDDGAVLTPANESAAQFDRMLTRARIDMAMLEAEKRVNPAHSIPIRMDVDRKNDRLSPRLFWPCDVWIVPFSPWPESIDYALAIIARISGGGGSAGGADGQLFEFLTRSAELDANGEPVFGPWRRQFVDGKDKSYEPPEGTEWDGPMPWCVYHLGMPEGSPFVDVDRDIVDEQLTVSESWTNYFHTLRYQAHDDTVFKSDSTKKRVMVIGPGRHNQIKTGESLENLTRNPKLDEYVRGLDAYTTAWAKSKRQPESSYAQDPAAPETGIARKIKERQYDKASRERELYAIAFWEQSLLPLMVAMSDYHLGTSIGQEGDVYRMTPAEPIEYEDPTQRDQRIDAAEVKGDISRARAAVDKELYPDEQTAAEVGLSRGVSQGAASGAPVAVPAADE